MSTKMETLITAGVEVSVETFYQEEYSKPADGQFTFAYRITISNHNLHTVQLLRRKWKITDANRTVRLVEGEGVVGRQPILYPGDSYQYVSGCTFNTGMGKMDGIYIFENKTTAHEFEVIVPEFTMALPNLLN
jgi:ApaG protein